MNEVMKVVIKESKKIRPKNLRLLIEIAAAYKSYEIVRPEDIADKFKVSMRTAYDYFEAIKALEIIFNL